MISEIEVFVSHISLSGTTYEIKVFARPDGRHIAKTVISKNDLVINDGHTLSDALNKQCDLLPLAIDSRRIMQEFKQKIPTHQFRN